MDDVLKKLSLNPASLAEAHLEGKAVVGKEKDLSALNVLTSCRVLVMSKCNITSLAAFPALHTLKKLDLRNNGLQGGFEPLGVLENLEWLYLDGNPLTTVDSLGGLKALGKLRHITLDGCPLMAMDNVEDAIYAALPQIASIDYTTQDGDDVDSDDEESSGEPSKPVALPRAESSGEYSSDEDDDDDGEDEENDEQTGPHEQAPPSILHDVINVNAEDSVSSFGLNTPMMGMQPPDTPDGNMGVDFGSALVGSVADVAIPGIITNPAADEDDGEDEESSEAIGLDYLTRDDADISDDVEDGFEPGEDVEDVEVEDDADEEDGPSAAKKARR